ncbi:MAG: SDR family oxidoreductase [Balneolaceae bacterium]|nr:SDR family oxidoreductase [Balneolaceae bacterium]
MKLRAFVTGGTGFIGINLVHLLLDRGWDVTALYRVSSDTSWLAGLPVRLKKGSVTDRNTLKRATPVGTDVVFHLAGSTNMWSERNEMQTRINVEGTRNMVHAAADNGVSTFIHTSSIAAWGRQEGQVTEETPQKGHKSWINYEYTKWAGEQEALKARDLGMNLVILNPAHVTGPYDVNNWGRLFLLLNEGKIPAIARGESSVTHVREVVKAHLAAVEHGTSGERYLLGGEENTFREFVKAIAEVSGIEKIPPTVPDWVLKSIARMSEFAATITGEEPDITPEIADFLTRKGVRYSSRKAEKQLGYQIVPMETAVRDCHRWLLENGYLDN